MLARDLKNVVACPGLPEDQDMQRIFGGPQSEKVVACPGLQEDQDMQLGNSQRSGLGHAHPNSPLGSACPGPPENQDMQTHFRMPNHPLFHFNFRLHVHGGLFGSAAYFACPGSQENQDMQTLTAS
jgi:hypothetical protein